MACKGRLIIPVFSEEANAVSSALVIFAFKYSRLLQRSRYSLPLPGIENSSGAESLSKEEMDLVSLCELFVNRYLVRCVVKEI